MKLWRGIVKEYGEYLPVTEKTPDITLNEGGTPLIRARNIARVKGLDFDIYFKYEGLNPTCSFKDRGMALAIPKAVEEGSRAVICASTGNTSASAAAFAARAGIKAVVLIPEGKIAFGKLIQALVHGAHVFQFDGNFDMALNVVREIVEVLDITLVNSINPYRLEGQKSGAFETADQLGGRAPDYHALPVGNAGNISAYWMGYKVYHDAGKIPQKPVMLGFQASGAAPLVHGKPVENPETIATAIRIGNPASWKLAEAARDESGGLIDEVTDEEILSAYALCANTEGVFCEPASAASLAGVLKLNNRGFFPKGATVVCTLTGHGLKDPDTVYKVAKEPKKLRADFDTVRAEISNLL